MYDAVACTLVIAPLDDNGMLWGVGISGVALCLLEGFVGVEAFCTFGLDEKPGSAEDVAPAR